MSRTIEMGEAESDHLYDLDYRATDEDPWYSVYAVFDPIAQKLTLKHSEDHSVVFTAADFATEAQVDELTGRFRAASVPVRDNQCRSLSIGTTVCAAHAINCDDLRFYDAVIQSVIRQPHSFAYGEEECMCKFELLWKNGRGRGTLTSVSIVYIFNGHPATQLDPRISAFATMVKKKIASSNSIVPINKKTESSQHRSTDMDTSMAQKSLVLESEGKMSSYNALTNQDEDMGSSCNTEVILISNLENDLTPSSIKDYIYKKTGILPQAFVFPRLFSDPYARGAIMVDSQKKAQIIYEFLENPNHIVVSSRERPWVVTEKASVGTFGPHIWNFIPMTQNEVKNKRTDASRTGEELQIVLSGTESYNRAKQLKDLLVHYIHHESRLCKTLVLEEQKIWDSFQLA